MSQNWTASNTSNPGNFKIQNFLEALRNSQGSAPSFKNPESQPGKNLFSEIQAKKETENRRIEQFHHQRSQEWNKIFSSKEISVQKRIEYLREELSKLSKQLIRLDINLKKSIESPVVDYGAYQENFLEHLKTRLHIFSLNVNKANSWLEVYQGRSKKQGAYWNMATKKGSSYTQNNERSISTSIG